MKPLFKRSVLHTMAYYGAEPREAIQFQYANPSYPFMFNNGTIAVFNGYQWERVESLRPQKSN